MFELAKDLLRMDFYGLTGHYGIPVILSTLALYIFPWRAVGSRFNTSWIEQTLAFAVTFVAIHFIAIYALVIAMDTHWGDSQSLIGVLWFTFKLASVPLFCSNLVIAFVLQARKKNDESLLIQSLGLTAVSLWVTLGYVLSFTYHRIFI